MKQQASMTGLAIVSAGLENKNNFSQRFHAEDQTEMTGAFAPIETLGWGLVIAQPVDTAFQAARRIRNYAVFWVGLSLLVAVFGGILFARGVSEPLRELVKGSLEIAKGDFDKRVPVRSKDEIGHLAETFNHMAHELKQSFSTVSEQLVEIRAWNKELDQRVKKRTRELREAQEQISRSQKLAAIGELGAGVAHEVNNPLTGIQGYAQIMLAKVKPDNPSYKPLSTIVEEAKKIRSIVADLLRFSQSPEDEIQAQIDLNYTVEKALQMVEGQLKEQGIAVEKSLSPDLPPVSGDPSALQQVIVHFIANAKNAMPMGGVLTLETEEVEGGAVKLVVGDTGRGIPEANLPRIFDPFFTTKDEWTGKGLGLSVANRIVEEHKGVIRVESEEGKGTTFTVVLPGVPRRLHLK
jgi:signal transduction histidine kinase